MSVPRPIHRDRQRQPAARIWKLLLAAWVLSRLTEGPQVLAEESRLPPLSEVVAAKRDLWGELALQQPNGASYEFFETLLPPPRYVHADFIKLHDVVRCWWQTRDTGWLREMRPRWEQELNRILENRTAATGLLPKERYCGDISTPVHALSVDAKAWRALRDLSPMLRVLDEDALAARVAQAEAEYKRQVLAAVTASVRTETTPPFVPIALLANEDVHDPITATRIGSYWNLMINYVVGSRLFPPGTEEETWLPRYLETHGGLCMGMTRSVCAARLRTAQRQIEYELAEFFCIFLRPEPSAVEIVLLESEAERDAVRIGAKAVVGPCEER